MAVSISAWNLSNYTIERGEEPVIILDEVIYPQNPDRTVMWVEHYTSLESPKNDSAVCVHYARDLCRLGYRSLGPLTNPTNATHQLIGVYDASVTEKIAKVLRILGLKKALVVHGEPGVDEVSVCGKTKVSQLSNGEIRTYFIKPEAFGVEMALPEKISGGDRKASARILRAVLSCKEEGAKRDVVLLNAAAAIFAADESRSIGDGFEIARDVLESGQAAEKLEEFVRFAK